jgi:hypothetical protein
VECADAAVKLVIFVLVVAGFGLLWNWWRFDWDDDDRD